MSLSPDCLDQWMGNYQDFFFALMNSVQPLAKCCGYAIEHDSSALQAAHAGWVAECDEWKSARIMQDSDGLSHIKILSILMEHLARVEWIKGLYEFDFENSRDARHYEFNGTEKDRQRTRQNINAGRGAYLGYQFGINLIVWYEKGRIDKLQPFAYRMTADLEHNFLVYLLSEKRDSMAVYLILKALFVRDDKPV